MSAKDKIFLSRREFFSAVRIDFGTYEPQNRLFRRLCREVLPDKVCLCDDAARQGVWVKPEGASGYRFLKGRELSRFVCRMLETGHFPLDRLSDICRMIFWTNAYGGKSPDGGQAGIWIETGMEDFTCALCGRCCLTLDYRSQCTAADYALWQRLGRQDVLARVAVVRSGREIISRQIWIDPKTKRFCDVCPWLVPLPANRGYQCGIHDIKPDICRQYPGTRKHAVMTGCSGFGDVCFVPEE